MQKKLISSPSKIDGWLMVLLAFLICNIVLGMSSFAQGYKALSMLLKTRSDFPYMTQYTHIFYSEILSTIVICIALGGVLTRKKYIIIAAFALRAALAVISTALTYNFLKLAGTDAATTADMMSGGVVMAIVAILTSVIWIVYCTKSIRVKIYCKT
jgi:hypothetical protein